MGILQNNNLYANVDAANKLQEASRSMSETVSGLKDQLVNPFKAVNSSISSGVALVKESQSQIMSNINSYKSKAILGIDTSLKNITGGFLNLSNIGRVISYQDGFKVNTDELLSIGSQGLGFNINSMKDLKQQIGNGFIDELDQMTDGLSRGLFFSDGTRLHVADDWKLGMGQSLIDFLAKDDQGTFGTIVNLAAVNSVLNTVLQQTVGTGMWQGYLNFSNMYVFQSDYHDALINSLGLAIGSGDVKSIQTILNIIKEEGINKVRSLYPDLIERMLTNFRFNLDDYPEDYPTIKALLLEVLVAVGGVNWYMYPTSMGMVYHMAMVNEISPDAKLLLSDEDSLIPLLCSSGIFMDRSAMETFKLDFPKAVVF